MELGWSQEELARRVKSNRAYIAQIESGRTKWPKSLIDSLTRELGLDKGELMVERMKDLNPDRVEHTVDPDGSEHVSMEWVSEDENSFLSLEDVPDEMRIGHLVASAELIALMSRNLDLTKMPPNDRDAIERLQELSARLMNEYGFEVSEEVNEKGRKAITVRRVRSDEPDLEAC